MKRSVLARQRTEAPVPVDPPERLTVRHVLADAYREIIGLDSPVLHTVRALTLHPGRFVRHYVERERAGFVGPVKYALLSLTVSVLIGQARHQFMGAGVASGWDAARTHAFYAAQDLRAYVVLLVLLPTSLLQWLLFRRARFNFAETYAFNAFIHGHLVWLGILASLVPPSLSVPFVGPAIAVGFLLWAICGFYQRYGPSVILRGLVLDGVYYLGMLAVLQAAILYLAR